MRHRWRQHSELIVPLSSQLFPSEEVGILKFSANVLIISTVDEVVGVAEIELSSIESEFGEVCLGKVTDIVGYAAASLAAVRDQSVGLSLEGHLGLTLNQEESKRERNKALHLGLVGGGVYLDFSRRARC